MIIKVYSRKINKNLYLSVLPVIMGKRTENKSIRLKRGLPLVSSKTKQAYKEYTIYLFREFIKPLPQL